MGLDPRRRRGAKDCPVSNCIPCEMDEEIERDIRKKYRICQQQDHNKKK